jgi:hypothetical protein
MPALCLSSIRNAISLLTRIPRIIKKRWKNMQKKKQQERRMATFLNNPVENKVKALELRLALLVTQRNLAFSLPKEIIDIFKKNCLVILS